MLAVDHLEKNAQAYQNTKKAPNVIKRVIVLLLVQNKRKYSLVST